MLSKIIKSGTNPQLPTPNPREADKSSQMIGGLPFATAVIYVVLFVVAFGVYNVLWKKAPVTVNDTSGYLEVAQDLRDLGIDTLHDRSAGYPLVLLLTGSSEAPNRLLFFVQLLFHFASVWLLAAVLYAAGAGQLLLRLFGLVILLPPYVEASGYAITESLAELTMVIGLAGIAFWYQNRQRQWLIAASVALGYSAITRPANQALVFVLIACLFVLSLLLNPVRMTRRDIKKAGTYLAAGTIGIVGLYSLMNLAKTGYFGVTPLMGYNLSTRTVRYIERLPDEYADVRSVMIKHRNQDLIEPGSSHTGYQYIWSAREELATTTGMKEPNLSNYLTRLNLILISKAPMEYLQDVAWGMSSYWFPSTRGLANFGAQPVQLVWAALHFTLLAIFGLQLMMFIGAQAFRISRRIVAGRKGITLYESDPKLRSLQVVSYTMAAAIVFYTMLLTTTLDVGQPRQRTSTEGLFLFMIFLGATMWGRMVTPPEPEEEADAQEDERRRRAEAWLRGETVDESLESSISEDKPPVSNDSKDRVPEPATAQSSDSTNTATVKVPAVKWRSNQ